MIYFQFLEKGFLLMETGIVSNEVLSYSLRFLWIEILEKSKKKTS